MQMNSSLNPMQRSVAIASLASEEFDVLVIGGGINGVGIALDAASRGLTVALSKVQILHLAPHPSLQS